MVLFPPNLTINTIMNKVNGCLRARNLSSGRSGGAVGDIINIIWTLVLVVAFIFGGRHFMKLVGGEMQRFGNEIAEKFASGLETAMATEEFQTEMMTFVSTNSPSVMLSWLRDNEEWLGEQGLKLTAIETGPEGGQDDE